MPARCILYVDGYNFYYAVKQHPNETPIHLGWCNFAALARRHLIDDGANLTRVKYFTAPVGTFGAPGGPAGSEEARQAIWLDAIRSVPEVEVIEGYHAGDSSSDPTRRARNRKEKQTDVNIAVSMVADAASDEFDRALLLTEDFDQAPTVRVVSQDFGKPVDVCLPPSADTMRWKLLAKGYRGVRVRSITAEMLRDSRLPEQIEHAGRIIQIPKFWAAPRA